MDDLISREQAIDALDTLAESYADDTEDDYFTGCYSGVNRSIDAIKALPTAQPEPCEDAVSRLEIVRNLHKYFKEGFEQDKWWNSGHVIHAIMDAPSATPKQRTGKWIFTKDYYWICSECGKNPTRGVGYVQGSSELFPHCPYCGSRNEVTE